jgi:exosome complex component RRP40
MDIKAKYVFCVAQVGTVIYARVTLALPFCEPELECFDPKTGKAQGFGDLAEGMLIRNLELSKCRACA